MCVKHEPVVLVLSSENSVIIVCFQDRLGSFPVFSTSATMYILYWTPLVSYSNEVCCNCTIMLLSIIIISSIWYTNTTTKYTSTIVPNWRNYMDRFSTILRVVLFNVFPFICELKTLIYRFSQG